ncbi:hypothetical protein [Protofrankia symbiont of Coriaria ruscifolia]|uniref:hypothetical protein n=1 Tax=Protofrankia symbiont of Coriaria ruscifolia TaxID=1306542 RepID=UPI001A94BF4A
MTMTTPSAPMTSFAGTARLTRFTLRRDRVQLPIWVAGTTAMLAVSLSATREQYPTEATASALCAASSTAPHSSCCATPPPGPVPARWACSRY